MSAQDGTPAQDAGVGMYALEVATLYSFAAFAVLALVALLLQELSIRVAPALGEAMVGDSAGLTWVAHACLIGFLTVGTIRWNFGGLDQLRRDHHRAALPRPAPLPVLPSDRAPPPRRSSTRPSRAYEPPPFAQRDPWTGAHPSFLTAIRRSYPVAGA